MEKLKEIVLKYKNIIAVLLTIFVAIGINVTFNKELNALKLDSSAYNIFYIIAIIGVFLLIYYSFKIREKRLWICSIILGLIFAICFTIGDVCNVYKDTLLPNSKKFALYLLIKIITYFILFNSIIAIALKKLPVIVEKWNKENKEYKYFTANKKSFWIIFGVFLISYIPFFLYYYPGSFQYDAMNALDQIVGNIPYKDYQPIIYTVFLGIFWNFGKAVFNSGNIGIALCTIMQMISTALVLSYVIYYMAKKNVPTKYRIITFIFLLFNPIIPMYTVRIEKSIYFALLLTLVTIQIMEMITNKDEYFKKKIHYVTLPIEILIMSLLRNNGIYITILLFIMLLILNRKYWKNILLLLLTPIILFYIIKGPVWNALNIIPEDAREALSIPVQQFARIIKYESDSLSDEEYNEIHKYLNMTDEEITEKYLPTLSDNIKANVNEEAFANDKFGLVKLYLKLALKYPGQTVSSFFINNYGYYAPNSVMVSGVYMFNEESKIALNTFKSEMNDLANVRKWDNKFIESLNKHMVNRDIPIISIFVDNVGLYFWIILFGITYLIYRKNYKLTSVYIPLVLLWLTTIIGPLVELRYVYTFIILVIPLMGITLFYNIKGVENEK